MINRILHSWSFHMKFINSPKARLINFIWNDHSCNILYIKNKSLYYEYIFFVHVNCFVCFFASYMHLITLLSHLLIARCDIGVQLSVRSFSPSVHNSCQGALLCSSDSWKYETLHSNYPWHTLQAGTLTRCPWPSFHAQLTLSNICVESRKFTSSLEKKFISLQQW